MVELGFRRVNKTPEAYEYLYVLTFFVFVSPLLWQSSIGVGSQVHIAGKLQRVKTHGRYTDIWYTLPLLTWYFLLNDVMSATVILGNRLRQ